MNKQRRHFAGTQKVAILKRHFLDKVPISAGWPGYHARVYWRSDERLSGIKG